MRRVGIGVGVLILFALVGGCVGTGIQKSPIGPKARVNIKISWHEFDPVVPRTTNQVSHAASPAEIVSADIKIPNVTHVGARLEYPGENAVFIQSVSKETANTEGIITMEVSPSALANLYVVAAEYGNKGYGTDIVHWFGTMKNLAIAPNSVLDIGMDDIEWVEATWHVDPAYKDAYENGTLVGDADKESMFFSIYVRDPFGIEHFRMYGTSTDRLSKDGWHEFGIGCENPTPGTPNVSRCHPKAQPDFYPTVQHDWFKLPQGTVMPGLLTILPLVEPLDVSWE